VKGYPQIEIAFDIKDVQLANKTKNKKIISVIGGGKLFIRANGKSCRITFKKSYLLLKAVQLINGYMRTPKIEALHRLITRFNSKHNTNIPLLGIDTCYAILATQYLLAILASNTRYPVLASDTCYAILATRYPAS
jgi:hypothetical protein